MIKRFRKIKDNLYRGSAPSVKDVIKIHKLLGIKRIVSLDQLASDRINNICKLLHIEHIIIHLDGTRKSLLKLLSYNLSDLLDSGIPTFLHCHEGKDRTGLVTALFKCKYMGMNPEDAIKEAESLGFGIDVPPSVINLFKKIIRSSSDVNNADIVSNERDYISDGKSSALDRADRGSFAPYLDKTQQYSYDPNIYNYQNIQGDSRINPESETYTTETREIPLVGLYDNTSGLRGVGPVDIGTGFIYDQ